MLKLDLNYIKRYSLISSLAFSNKFHPFPINKNDLFLAVVQRTNRKWTEVIYFIKLGCSSTSVDYIFSSYVDLMNAYSYNQLQNIYLEI